MSCGAAENAFLRDVERYERQREAPDLKALAVAPFSPLSEESAAEAAQGIMCRQAAATLCEFEAALADASTLGATHDRLFGREATASSHIEEEGRDVSPRIIAGLLGSIRSGAGTLSVFAADYGFRSGVSSILCCAAATEHLADARLGTASLLRAHKTLMRYRSDRHPGKFRTSGRNAYIGSPSHVVYVPPLGGPAIGQMMGDLMRWVGGRLRNLREIAKPQDKWAYAVAVSGVAHMRFEAIHPFSDGNGRIGRSFAEAILMASLPKYMRAPVGVGSSFSHPAPRNGYYSALGQYRDMGALFAGWWAEQVETAASTALPLIRSGSDEAWANSSWFD